MDEVFENNVFWQLGPTGIKEGPYCPNNECLHDSNDQRQRLLDNGNGSYSCPQCKSFVIVDREKWNTHSEALSTALEVDDYEA
ncbi:hypothetical protein BVY00_00165 [bacterium G20]|nr:hypothetical protein BVY00_00165 [bacterium G20]